MGYHQRKFGKCRMGHGQHHLPPFLPWEHPHRTDHKSLVFLDRSKPRKLGPTPWTVLKENTPQQPDCSLRVGRNPKKKNKLNKTANLHVIRIAGLSHQYMCFSLVGLNQYTKFYTKHHHPNFQLFIPFQDHRPYQDDSWSPLSYKPSLDHPARHSWKPLGHHNTWCYHSSLVPYRTSSIT